MKLENIFSTKVRCTPDIPISFNSSLPGQDGRHFADDILRCLFMNEKLRILTKNSLKFVRKDPIDNNPA